MNEVAALLRNPQSFSKPEQPSLLESGLQAAFQKNMELRDRIAELEEKLVLLNTYLEELEKELIRK